MHGLLQAEPTAFPGCGCLGGERSKRERKNNEIGRTGRQKQTKVRDVNQQLSEEIG